MHRQIIDAAGFETKFRKNIDPWNYTASAFEAHKRGILLHACGSRRYARALELACAIGETTRALAPRCLRILALDASATALREADYRTRVWRNITLKLALLPRDTPRGPFDLIVASEIFYYLKPGDLRLLVIRLERALAPGGRLVVLHHLRDFKDAAIRPRVAQEYAFRAFHRRMRLAFVHRTDRFQAAAFDRYFR